MNVLCAAACHEPWVVMLQRRPLGCSLVERRTTWERARVWLGPFTVSVDFLGE